MFKKITIGMMSALMLAFMISCQSGNSGASDTDRGNVEANTVQPANPATPQQTVQQPTAPAGPTTVMSFNETTFDFGSVQDGEKVAHTYKFKNTGSEPLILSDAKGSCGCTVPKWPREPIAPGGEGEITVEFNSKNKKGKRNQKVTITANTDPPQTFIYLTGEVIGGDDSGQPSIQVTQ